MIQWFIFRSILEDLYISLIASDSLDIQRFISASRHNRFGKKIHQRDKGYGNQKIGPIRRVEADSLKRNKIYFGITLLDFTIGRDPE